MSHEQGREQMQRLRARLEGSKEGLEYHLEGAIIDVTEDICVRMEERGFTRAEMARRLGTSKAYITRILRGDANFTLKSLTAIAMALDCDLSVHLVRRRTESLPTVVRAEYVLESASPPGPDPQARQSRP